MTAPAALVTGASAGIGLAVTALLVERGYGVTMVGRDRSRLDNARSTLPAAAQLECVAADAADGDAVAGAVERHLQRFGRLDVVVANAGTGSGGGVASTRPHHLEGMLRTNVVSLFTLAAAAMPALRIAGGEHRRAWFIVTASISGVRPAAGFAAYSASKAAAMSVARSVDVEESHRGVRACALCPGFVATAMTEWTRDSVPADTMLQPSDVAAAVAFLLALSPTASVTEIVIGRTGAPPLAP